MLSLPPGQPARLSIALAIAGTPTDSSTMTLKIEEPDGTITSKTIGQLSHDGTGAYHYDFPTVKSGMHSFYFNSTSGVLAAAQEVFFVQLLLPS